MKFFRLILFSFTLTTAVGAFAKPLCKKSEGSTELCSIQVLDGGREFSYFYEIRRAKEGKPTIIALPGGPGQGLIGEINKIAGGDFIPEDYGIILIDQRGFGKNDFGPDETGAIYSSQQLASDVQQVIKDEQLTKYFIHGQSYGTVMATILGSNISGQSEVSRPLGVVLSGVVNKYFKEPVSGYNDQLQRLINLYSPVDQLQIKKSLATLREEFGQNDRIFAVLFISLLTANFENSFSNGKNSTNMKTFFDLLAKGVFDESNQAIDFFKKTAQSVGKVRKPINHMRNNTMPEVIKCREMTSIDGMWDLSFDLDKFLLMTKYSDCSEKGYVLDRPFESINFQIANIPIFYIQGDFDPATPLSGAFDHFKSQKTKQKIFITLKTYSHTALWGLQPCKDGLWSALESGIESFHQHILKCDQAWISVLR